MAALVILIILGTWCLGTCQLVVEDGAERRKERGR